MTWPAPNPADLQLIGEPDYWVTELALRRWTGTPSTAAQRVIARADGTQPRVHAGEVVG